MGRTASEAVEAIDRYLANLLEQRHAIMGMPRTAILRNLPAGYVERLDNGMLTYETPVAACPKTHNCRPVLLAGLASQKFFVTLYLMAVYGDKATEEWFRQFYSMSGKKLNMGKSCAQFKTLEDVPVEVIGQAIGSVPARKYMEMYETARPRGRGK